MKQRKKIEKTRKCNDCENVVKETDGRPYKYEKSVWLCDDCHDARMEENEKEGSINA